MKQITKKDLKGQLIGFPVEVVMKMIEYQVEQGNSPNVRIFQKDKFQNNQNGGFSWNNTVDGYDFWYQVIACCDFNHFFNKYPNHLDAADELDSNPTNTKLEVTMEQIAEKFGVDVEDLVIKN